MDLKVEILIAKYHNHRFLKKSFKWIIDLILLIGVLKKNQ
jgi:hypothetical protein